MFDEFRNFGREKINEKDEFDELIEEITKEEKFGIKKNLSMNVELNKENTIDLNYVEITLNLFTIEKGTMKILLLRKKDEPYKGHWILPSKRLSTETSIKKCIDDIVYLQLKLNDLDFKQSGFMSNVNTEKPNSVILSYIGVINIEKFKENINKDIDYGWFPVVDLPKIAYEYSKIIINNQIYLKDLLIKLKNIRTIFPKHFSISELQYIYELLFEQKFDRRNFRKKFVRSGIIEETGDINEHTNGRPAKLYRFKEDMRDINLF